MDSESDGVVEKKNTNITLVLHSIPSAEDQFHDKLRETSELNPNGPSPNSGTAISLNCEDVVDIVVGPSHLGLLLKNGKVCRLKYSVDLERLDVGKSDATKSSSVTKAPSTNNAAKPTTNAPAASAAAARSAGARTRTTARLSTGRIPASSTLSGLSSSSVTGRLTRAGLSRGPVVPALYVPEELVSQAQMVLQGKSRAVIVRELQRTNLDVNLAVNNLLSRDDEENDGGDDVDSYVSDDLISLLDAGLSASEHPSVIIDAERLFSEDVLGYAPRRTFGRSAARDRDFRSSTSDRDAGCPEEGSSAADRESRDSLFRGWRERAYGSQSSSSSGRDLTKARWLESAIRDSFDKDSERSKKKESTPVESNTVLNVEELEYWPEEDLDKGDKFVKIASMYSELVAVTEKGKLCQWKWASIKPYRCSKDRRVRHPRARGLCLNNEKISMISASMIRCSVVTETSKVATWVDESISGYGGRLEHSAMSFAEFGKENVAEIFTCPLYTCVRLSGGSLFWWGVWPYEQRKKQFEESRARLRKNHTEAASALSEGSIVTLKSCPVYQANAVGFNLASGEPKVGRLLTSAWSFGETKNFSLIDGSVDRGGDANASSAANATPRARKRKLEAMEEGGSPPEETQEDVAWNVKDVVFLEDIRTVATAEVLRVDGPYAICRFHGKNEEINMNSPKVSRKKSRLEKRKDDEGDGGTSSDKESPDTPSSEKLEHWKESRVLRTDDLVVVKPGSLKQLESFQKLPRKVPICDPSKILSLKVDKIGVHAIVKNSNGHLSYTVYNLATGKTARHSNFPRESSSFLCETGGIQLRGCGDITADENDSVTMLLDGNRAIYPLAKNSVQGIRDPWWLDMRPLSCLGLGVSPVPVGAPTDRGAVAVVAMAFRDQVLMPHVLHSDLDRVNSALADLEKKSEAEDFDGTMRKIVEERCDGNRNIVHACVLINRPVANIESDLLDPAPDEEVVSLMHWGESGSSNLGGSSSSNDPVSVVEDLLEIYGRGGSGSAARRRRHEFRPLAARSRRQIGVSLRSDDADNDKDSKSSDSNEGIDKKPTPAYLIALAVCKASALQQYMYELLTTRNAEGFTPFMMAISGKAYPIGLLIWDAMKAALAHANKEMTFENLRPMICPVGTKPDDSPLMLLCLNDLCSFTWTGAEHINQDIYECRTCGLVGSLCCCTECARICHKNHDCKLKQASPTAYCDCWEKCRCKALLGGNQKARRELFQKLIQFQEMLVMPNSRGENIIMFLIQTVARQITEHKHGPHRNRGVLTKRRNPPDTDQSVDMPDHDLDPPKFCRRALEHLLVDYQAVRTLIMSGVQQYAYAPSHLMLPGRFAVFNRDEEEMYLSGQDGCSQLDRFTHCMLTKVYDESEDFYYCGNTELTMMSNILDTLVSGMKDKNPERATEAQFLARRFTRSVVRQYVVAAVGFSPSALRKKIHPGQVNTGYIVNRCKKIFQHLIGVSLMELCDAADALIAPVRLGIVKPTAPFMQLSTPSDVIQASDDVFGGDSMFPSGHDDQRPDNDSRRRHSRYGGDGDFPASQSSGVSRRGDRSFLAGPNDTMNTSAGSEWEVLLSNDFGTVNRRRDRGGDDASNKDRARSSRSSARASTAAPGGGDDDGDDDDDEDNDDENDDDLFREGESAGPPGEPMDSSRNAAGEDVAGGDDEEGNEEDAVQDVEMRDADAEGASSDLIEYVIKDYSDSDDEGAGGNRSRSGDNNDAESGDRPREDQPGGEANDGNDPNGEGHNDLVDYADLSFLLSEDDDDDESNESSVVEETEEEDDDDDHTVYESDRAASPVESGVARTGAGATSTTQSQPSVPVPAGLISDAGYSSRSRASTLTSVAPHLAWALGRPQERTRTGGSSGLIYIDSVSLRRAAGTTSTSGAGGSTSSDNARVALAPQEPWNMSSTAHGLARAFGIIVRQIAELLARAGSPGSGLKGFKMSSDELKRVERYVERRLKRTWDWLLEIMDTTEAQLRFGAALSQASGKATSVHPDTLGRYLGAPGRDREPVAGSRSGLPLGVTGHRIRDILGRSSSRRVRVGGSAEATSAARRDFMSYMVSLMRGQTGEHLDALPHVDIASMKHVAYIFDALMFYMRSSTDNLVDTTVEFPSPKIGSLIVETSPVLDDSDDSQKEEKPEKPLQVAGPSHSFFRRSESTLYLGGHAPDAFATPMVQALPLADQPQLLNSNSRREELFGILPHPVPAGDSGPSWYHGPRHLGFADRGPRSSGDDDDDDASSGGGVRMTFPDNLRSDPSALSDVDGGGIDQSSLTYQILMGRWRLTLELFGRVFVDDVGQEPGSLMSELGGFQVREARFRREMEKLRSGSTRDLTLSKVERNRALLIQQFFRELNTFYNSNSKKTNGNNSYAPLAIARVKVTFRDEPGEGSGVARSFYTALAEALVAPEPLPNLENCQVEPKNFSGVLQSLPKMSGRFSREGRGAARNRREPRRPLSTDARPYYLPPEGRSTDYSARSGRDFGDRLLPKVQSLRPSLASRITGMLLELPPGEVLTLLGSDDLLRQRVDEAWDLLQPVRDQSDGSNDALDMDFFGLQPRGSGSRGEAGSGGSSGGPGSGTGPGSSPSGGFEAETPPEPSDIDPDNTPLFFCPGKKGFYSPRYGRWSPERINAFRNIGRLIGLCLLQNELCPLYLNRHVFKYILGRQIRWHDLAFYDPQMYESFRQLIIDVRSAEGKDADAVMESYDLIFSINVRPEEGGEDHELIADCGNVAVTPKNVYDYVRRYALFRMVESQEKALEAIKKGVHDVIPQSALDGLTSEDFRLLLNGVGEVQVSSLVSFTTFHDESGEGGEKLARYRRWFWSVVEKMGIDERQDLVYFWTGSPALPASEEGFQPMPSITIRPADDNHLPTANTCISRLYLPLYSSKSILKSKLLLAVKAKNFGFV